MNIRVKNTFSTTNIIIMLEVAILIMVGATFSYFQYVEQVADQYRITTNNTATKLVELTTAIHNSDNIRENQTKYLLGIAVNNSYANYLQLVNATNQTNTLLQFLTDNFGANSGYLERENFQYSQENETHDYIHQALENQQDITELIKNQTGKP